MLSLVLFIFLKLPLPPQRFLGSTLLLKGLSCIPNAAVVLLPAFRDPTHPLLSQHSDFATVFVPMIWLPAGGTKARPATTALHLLPHAWIANNHILTLRIWALYPPNKLADCLLQLHASEGF
jgi:hypothetical protein